uniref:DOMON domain-containing protein n=2 Tax=Viridiplantae TaxID=33090 RepID=A0A7S3UFS0_9CHLO|eukprot:PRCOL_00002893-RA
MARSRAFCGLGLAVVIACGCAALASAQQGNESHHDLPDAPEGGVSLGLCKYVPAKGNSTCAVSFKSAAAISSWKMHVHVGNTTAGEVVKGIIYGGQATADGMAVGIADGEYLSAIFPGNPNETSTPSMPPQAKEHVLAQIKVTQPTGANATLVKHLCIHHADFFNSTGGEMEVKINASSLCQEEEDEESSSWFTAGRLFIILLIIVVVLAGGYFGFTYFKKRQAAKRHAANVYGYNQENI